MEYIFEVKFDIQICPNIFSRYIPTLPISFRLKEIIGLVQFYQNVPERNLYFCRFGDQPIFEVQIVIRPIIIVDTNDVRGTLVHLIESTGFL